MNCKKCDQTVFDLSIRSLKDIPNGPKCDQKVPDDLSQRFGDTCLQGEKILV